jgi:tight adherence protein C
VSPLLPGAALAACVLVAAAGLALLRTTPQGTRALIENLVADRRGPRPRRADVTERLGQRFAKQALSIMSERRLALLRHRLDAAGRPDGMTLERYAARKAGFAVVFACAGLVLFLLTSSFPLIPAMVALGWLLVDLKLAGTAKRRQAQIDRDLPDFLDVLAVTVSAGLGFRSALERVATTRPGPLSEEVRTTLQQMGIGVSRRAAFEALRERNDSEQLGQFVTALLQAEELGTPLTDALASIADDMRKEFAQLARRQAARAAPRVSVIVTTIVVPGAIVLILAGLLSGSNAPVGGLFGQ